MSTVRTLGTPRLWAALTGLFGIATLVVSTAFKLLPAARAAAACTGDSAVLRFELARNAADLTAIFHAAGDPCRGKIIAAMDAVNHLDAAAFIPAYSLFAVCAALFLGVGRLKPLVLAALALAALACAADYVETLSLLAITPGIETAAHLTPVASTAAWIKFGALAAHGLVLALLALQDRPRRRILAVLLVLPIIAYVAALLDRANMGFLTLATVPGWLLLMLLALWRAIRGERPIA